jgi:hypothetical protein
MDKSPGGKISEGLGDWEPGERMTTQKKKARKTYSLTKEQVVVVCQNAVRSEVDLADPEVFHAFEFGYALAWEQFTRFLLKDDRTTMRANLRKLRAANYESPKRRGIAEPEQGNFAEVEPTVSK